MSYRNTHRAGRISNREMRRMATRTIAAAKASAEAGERAYLVLIAALAQAGGELRVTQGTIDQVGANLAKMSYTIQPNPADKKEFFIRLVDGSAEAEEQVPTPATEEPVNADTE